MQPQHNASINIHSPNELLRFLDIFRQISDTLYIIPNFKQFFKFILQNKLSLDFLAKAW